MKSGEGLFRLEIVWLTLFHEIRVEGSPFGTLSSLFVHAYHFQTLKITMLIHGSKLSPGTILGAQ